MKILVTGGSGFIGTNYIDSLLKIMNYSILNIDINKPKKIDHEKYWRECNILDYGRLAAIIKDFKPDYVVHLAAQTGVNRLNDIHSFDTNIQGVKNLINALNEVNSTKRVIFTSSLLVCKMGYMPKSDTDYMPSTAYGVSKVEGEEIVRGWEDLPFSWTIIRPIAVWGPWMGEPYFNFFKSVMQGWYFHIGNGHYHRSMGYVENIAHEMHSILCAPSTKVHQKTYYLGDPIPTDLYKFAEEIRAQTGSRRIMHIPLSMAKMAAGIGDLFKAIGWVSVPLSSFRLNNITTEYTFDLSPIISIAGEVPFGYKEGISRTLEWMKSV